MTRSIFFEFVDIFVDAINEGEGGARSLFGDDGAEDGGEEDEVERHGEDGRDDSHGIEAP
jgi:hypothetical protein